MKRKSPSSPLPESFSNHRGFKILPLPITFPSPSSTSTLRRTLSDPFNSTASASAHHLPALSPETTVPTKPSSPANPSFSDPFAVASGIEQQSTSSKNLKKIKEFIREMNQWCHQLMQEEEEHCEYDDHNNLQNETEINGGGNQEAVSVEKCGNRVAIHFNCPCGKSHRILQAGNNFYYNLI